MRWQLAAGGWQQAGRWSLVASAIAALPVTLTWTTSSSPLPRGVDHHATFVTAGDSGTILHVLGGNNYQEQFATHWSAPIQSDGSVGAWRDEAAFPTIILGHTVVVVGRTAFAIAGQNAGRRNSAEVYRAPLDRYGRVGPWTAAPALPAPRFHHAALANGNDVYVFGGLETTTSSNTVFRARVGIDGSLSTWETLDTLARPRSHQAAFVHQGAVYLIGGLDGNPAGANTPLNDVVRATILPDGRLGAWQTVSTLDSAYGTHGAFLHGGYVHVAGGVENNRRFVDRVQRAALRNDGTIGPWEDAAVLPQARGHVHHLPVVGDAVYSAGGSRSRQVMADVYVGRLP